METAIGVFTSRDRAEAAVKELLAKQVPPQAIVFLTRSESDAATLGKEIGAYAGGFVGGSAGLAGAAVASLAIPGIGLVFALGVGATALLGLIGAGTGAAVGKAASGESGAPHPSASTPAGKDDSEFFREVLKQGRSIIVVRTESHEVAAPACGVLDRLGISMLARPSGAMDCSSRQVGGVAVLDVRGKITLGQGNVMLREHIQGLLDKGNNRILLNLSEVDYVDSSGLGELVRTHATTRSQGGQLKLVNPSKRVRELLQATNLIAVLDVQPDEAAAVKSFGAAPASGASR